MTFPRASNSPLVALFAFPLFAAACGGDGASSTGSGAADPGAGGSGGDVGSQGGGGAGGLGGAGRRDGDHDRIRWEHRDGDELGVELQHRWRLLPAR